MISLRAYAKHRDISVQAVSQAVKAGRLKKCIVRNSLNHPKVTTLEAADAEWDANTRAPNHTLAEPTPRRPPVMPGPFDAEPEEREVFNIAEEQGRRLHWQAELAELEFRVKSGEMIPIAEAEKTIDEILAEVKVKLLALPYSIKQRIPKLTVGDVEKIEALIKEALEALATDDDEGDAEQS